LALVNYELMRNSSNKKKAYIFQHFQKNAGSSLNANLPVSHTLNSISTWISLCDKAKDHGTDMSRYIVTGHDCIGAHDYFSDDVDVMYFTLFRSPFTRFRSYYNYNMVYNKELTLEKALCNFKSMNYVNYFGQGNLEKALERFYSLFSLYGLVERYDEFIPLIEELLSLDITEFKNRNINNKPKIEFSESDIELIKHDLSKDELFYQSVYSNYMERIKPLSTSEIKVNFNNDEESFTLFGVEDDLKGPVWFEPLAKYKQALEDGDHKAAEKHYLTYAKNSDMPDEMLIRFYFGRDKKKYLSELLALASKVDPRITEVSYSFINRKMMELILLSGDSRIICHLNSFKIREKFSKLLEKNYNRIAIFGTAKAAAFLTNQTDFMMINTICYIDDFKTGADYQQSVDAIFFGTYQAGSVERREGLARPVVNYDNFITEIVGCR